MLRITIELVSCINGQVKHLGTAEIANDASGDHTTGNYRVALSKWGKPKEIWKSGTVKGFKRLRHGPWDLLYLALRNIVGSRHGEASNAS